MSSSEKWLIFNLGTNNWQGGSEFAPGSGILHEGHHSSLNALKDDVIGCYSMWPSKTQTTPTDRDDYRVFTLKHDIPICESVSPVSSYRWHSMSEEEFSAYKERLVSEVMSYMEEVEKKTGHQFNLLIAHHTFLNPIVMVEVNKRRVAAGKPRATVICFSHGTALKMYQNEKKQLPDFPMRFLPLIEKERIFEDDSLVQGVFVVASPQIEIFRSIFPNFPVKKISVAPCGYNKEKFNVIPGLTRADVLPKLSPKYVEGLEAKTTSDDNKTLLSQLRGKPIDVSPFTHHVSFAGKFADWKRVDVFIKAAAIFIKDLEAKGHKVVATVTGGGPAEDEQMLHELAYCQCGLGGKLFFLGPQSQDELARINNVADVAVYPSKDEPFGLVFIETMACGTPVIGARSGGPVDFIHEDVGVLIEESTDHDVLAKRCAEAVETAINNDWKKTKGPRCAEYASTDFTLVAQCKTMLHMINTLFKK